MRIVEQNRLTESTLRKWMGSARTFKFWITEKDEEGWRWIGNGDFLLQLQTELPTKYPPGKYGEIGDRVGRPEENEPCPLRPVCIENFRSMKGAFSPLEIIEGPIESPWQKYSFYKMGNGEEEFRIQSRYVEIIKDLGLNVFYSSGFRDALPVGTQDLDNHTLINGLVVPLISQEESREHMVLGDSRKMDKIEDESAHLIFTSPPFFLNKSYDLDKWEDHWSLLCDVASEMVRVTVPGGMIMFELPPITNWGKRTQGFEEEYDPFPYLYNEVFRPREVFRIATFYWNKKITPWKRMSARWSNSGTFTHVKTSHRITPFYVLRKGKEPRKDIRDIQEHMHKLDFLEVASGMVDVLPVHGHKRHDGMFPVRLAHYFIETFSYEDDLVIDPFAGTGTTGVAARLLGRRFLGYEIKQKYYDLAVSRLSQPSALDGRVPF